MNAEQQQRALQVWQVYCDNGEHFVNASQEYTHEELDRRRSEVIPELKTCLEKFLSGQMPLDEFKTRVDSINKSNRLWGFKGFNGQVLFNMLLKYSQAGEKLAECEEILKYSLPLPADLDQVDKVLDSFAGFARSLAPYARDRRSAPKVGAIPYFLSYFWQIQAPSQFPVYYSSMVDVLIEMNIWTPLATIAESYTSFYKLNQELLSLFCQHSGRQLTLWDVEHAFWFHAQQDQETETGMSREEQGIGLEPGTPGAVILEELPESYIPPVVGILPRLAINDQKLARICEENGRSIEKVFEERVDVLFRMLGYETEALGQGHGRVPDGVAICKEFHYAIGYDAKVRQQAYTMGTDERAIREYIYALTERFRHQGIRNIYFMIISSSFSGDHDDVIRNIKMDTDIREVLLVEAGALLALLEAKLREPTLTLGQEGIQRLFADSGLLTEADIREFQGI